MGRLFIFCSTTELLFLLRSKIPTTCCVRIGKKTTTYGGSKVSFFKIQKDRKFEATAAIPFPCHPQMGNLSRMEWTDEGLLLSAQPHGETSVIVTLLTATHGRHAGLVSGGQSRKNQATLQIGNHVTSRWRARLSDHLGNLSLEVITPTAAPWLSNPEILALIASAAAVTEASLPERQPMPELYHALQTLFALEEPHLWGPTYIAWEIGVLKSLGYGMDFSCCALSGSTEGLAYISPRTGRAVTAEAAIPYIGKLLPLPGFLCGAANWDEADILKGLDLTGHFLCRHVFAHPQNRRLVPVDGTLPFARQRLADYYRNRLNQNAAVA